MRRRRSWAVVKRKSFDFLAALDTAAAAAANALAGG